MIEKLHSDFGPEIALEEAMSILDTWCTAGLEHAFAFNGMSESSIVVLSKITQAHENMIACKGESSELFFRLEEARFAYGPMALMEHPIKQESSVEGLHVFLGTGNYLFISSQTQLPNTETFSLSVLYNYGKNTL